MTETTTHPRPPRDPRHQRFADELFGGMGPTDAYIAAGYKCSRKTATSNAKKLRRKPQVAAYIKALQTKAAEESNLTINEILRFCARVVRTGIGDLDPSPGSPTADLIKHHSENESETGTSRRIEKLCPFKAIDTHLKLTGHDPQANSLKEIAAALGALAGPVLPTDKL